eukprot:TRINITY_DN2977_c0_g1_i5.p1 TRINITY_DN2977_c0_g1~~TRINITY_DN2977_c0_g1_i5.p1  ORF type:complete len:223 (-),score=29.43 TRINITY_DN2977_c0_g1_i5:57-725(-)
MTTDPKFDLLNVVNSTWAKFARNLGISVLYFGEETYRPSTTTPHDFVVLNGYNYDRASNGGIAIEDLIFSLDELLTRYQFKKSWYMLVTDKTFVHPHVLVHEILCKYKNSRQFIGQQTFTGTDSAFLVTSDVLVELMYRWKSGGCRGRSGEGDVDISNCLFKLGLVDFHVHPCLGRSNLEEQDNAPCSLYPLESNKMKDLTTETLDHCHYRGIRRVGKVVTL